MTRLYRQRAGARPRAGAACITGLKTPGGARYSDLGDVAHDARNAVAGRLALSPCGAVTGGSPDGARDRGLLSADPGARLQAWQTRLASHFAQIAAIRREADWPVFALEHGLSASEREALMRDIRMCAAAGFATGAPLPWVVYAAEIGYEYSGYEYWQTFAQKTPELDKRYFTRISSLFAAFAETYHGAVPDGPWALWFRHIAWPITHGILPRDLQRQLAELLYDASMSFRAETFSSAEALGRHLQARCNVYSSRFRQFAENTTLLGQIALALLLQDAVDAPGGSAGTILHANALARIVEDLNRERDARQWLADARSAARFRVRGLSRIPLRERAAHSVPSGDRSGDPHDGTASLPQPHFILREEAADRWQIRLQLPNLAHLAQRSHRTREILARTQGRVAGAAVPVLATRRIIQDAVPTVALSTWPASQTQLLTFEGAPPELNAVLRASFRMDAAERWLFSIGSDGQARELGTRVLRAGASYLLLQKAETRNPVAGLGLRAVRVACSGIYGLRIDVPENVTDALVDVLSILGLKVARTLDVWPAGLPVVQWSDDGQAEWVTGQPIVLGVRADHPLTRLTVTIDGMRQTAIKIAADAAPGAPLFVQLPYLAAGQHCIAVMAHTTGSVEEAAVEASVCRAAPPGLSGELLCIVREPRTVAAGQTGALSFAVLPAAPSLEDVWDDRVEIHVAAPGSATIRGCVTLRGVGREELFKRSLSLPSPCDTLAWRSEFAAIRKAAEAKYDEAQTCVLEFDGGVLGRGRVTAERDFTPLRWAVRANARRVVLIDSRGCVDLSVCTIPCAAPSLEQSVDATVALDGIEVRDGGALVVARAGTLEVVTVVVPPQRITSLSALSGERPCVAVPPRDASSIFALARVTSLWERARLAGNSLAAVRRTAVVEALVASISICVAGERWARAEDVLRDRGPQAAVNLLQGLVANRPDERAIAGVLANRVASTADASLVEAGSVFLDALTPFIPASDLDVLAPFALRFAASPGEARAFVDELSDAGSDSIMRERALIASLLATPVVLRAARYFIVASRALASAEERDHRALPWGH